MSALSWLPEATGASDWPRAHVVVAGLGVSGFASLVDRLAFGPSAASGGDADDAWAQVHRVRRRLAVSTRCRDRWRAAVSLRSLGAGDRHVGRGVARRAPVSPSRLHLDRLAP